MSVAKSAAPVIDPGMCRCCGTMKRCRFLNVEYQHLGNKEIYSEMIMDCFGLLISYMDSKPTERLICATCVMRLREATAFRKQVLLCEEAFLQMKIIDTKGLSSSTLDYSSQDPAEPPKLEVEVEVKLEELEHPSPGNHDQDMLADHGYYGAAASSTLAHTPQTTNEDSNSNDDLPLHNLITRKATNRPLQADSRPLKTETRPPKTDTRSPKPDIRPHKAKSLRSNPIPKRLRKSSSSLTSNLKNAPKVRIQEPYSDINAAASDGKTTKPKLPMSKVQEMMRERDPTYMTEINILTIVEYSFACPFKCRHNNLLCYYCGEYFLDSQLLRDHTESKHNPNKFKISDKLMIKVDLTRIDCRLCPAKIDTLDSFKLHLTSVHKKKYYFEHKDSILPFKLSKELKCAICEMKFQYFHALNKHMNVHFSNYVCETCGLGFVDRGRFLMHQQRHDVGDFPCEQCGKVFKAQYNRDLHIDRVHEKRARVYCPKCDVKLMTYHHKLKHLVEVHGEEPLSFPCDMCERVFGNRRMLTVHRRKDHLKDFRYECSFCCQKFFTRFALNNHLPTHTLERNFRCQVCAKAYPRLKTLKDHMRIHTNDRRYRCQICGQGFIQNCSLKGHMKSQHPEYG